MKSQQEIDRITESALSSLDNLQQVEANDFLYSKIINRMQMRGQQDRAAFRSLMMRLSFALVLFAGINVASFLVLEHQRNKPQKPAKLNEAAFASEYSLTNNGYNY